MVWWKLTCLIVRRFCMKNDLILCLLLLSSCISQPSGRDVFRDVEVISIHDAVRDDVSFLDSIEIIPLDNGDNALLKEFSRFRYLKAQKMFLVIDSRQYVFLFDESGNYISSSDSCRGEGPHDYLMAADAVYNPYADVIEIYSPVGKGIVHRYDLSFRWLENRKLPYTDPYIGARMDILDKDVYAFEPVRNDEEHLAIRTVDFTDSRSPRTEDVPLVQEGYVSTLTMMQKSFFRGDTALYFTPYYLDYHFYEYDLLKRRCRPIYELDLGEAITKSELDERLSDRKGSKELLWEKCEYLLSSKYLLPIIRLMDDSFVYACCIRERETYHLLHNRKTKKTYFLSPDAPLRMHRCYDLQDNVLATILFPYELDKYISETSKQYMSEETLEKLSEAREEDNPIIIKYYLAE